MNDCQCRQIEAMRKQGMGYKAIASKTKLSRDSVRNYCRWHHLAGYGRAVAAAFSWNATQMVQNLEDMGFTMVPFGQGFKDMSPPSKELFKLLMEGNIIHGGNPVLKWMAGNVVMRQNPAENIKPDKEKSVEKIDGIVASIMALDRCIRNGTGSVYDERGVIAF